MADLGQSQYLLTIWRRISFIWRISKGSRKIFVLVARNIRALPLHAISGPLKFFCKTTLVTRGSTRRIRAARTFI